MKKYAIIGFGGLGKMHLSNMVKLEKERGDFKLAAICGTTLEEATKSVQINLGTVDLSDVDFSSCNFYQDYKEMINKEKLDFVLSVLPTYLHEEVAIYCLEHGVNVLSEKPMALTLESCERMLKAADKSGKELMIGQCLRFNPIFKKIKEYVDTECFGKVYRAEFTRLSQTPLWTWQNWILDPTQSGGCILDMHVHDVDLINWLFGLPNSLRSTITERKVKQESVFTQYFYDDFFVTAQADWSMPQTFPFTARCRINFEHAVVTVEDNKLMVYEDRESYSPEISAESDLVEEERAFLELVIDKKTCDITSAQSVYNSVMLALTEVESAKQNKVISIKKLK